MYFDRELAGEIPNDAASASEKSLEVIGGKQNVINGEAMNRV